MKAVRDARKQYGRRKRNRQLGLLLRGCTRLRAGPPLVTNLPADNYTELAVKSRTAGARQAASAHAELILPGLLLAFDVVEFFLAILL